ncbi:MAG TPA: ARMT1-like domain-containing protein [Dysgonamonadaceae bacterium]|nr:ARMT1-like domain-containing protein [Dysgonamonadaceae bacterium]
MQTIVITMTNTNTLANTERQKYEVDTRCMDCHFNAFDRLLTKHEATYNQRQEFFGYFNLVMARGASLTMAQLYSELNREFCRITGVNNPYAKEKAESNSLSLSLYKKFRTKVLESANPFDMALCLAIAGNIIDYGANANFDVPVTIQKVLESEFAIDHSKELITRIKSASRILYLGDNAGEIVFDKLFIEMIMHPRLTFVVRGSHVLNDATLEDAQQVGMNLVADVISNGYDAPSTVLSECSDEFLRHYNEADLIISKGQGNFEGLIEENDPRIFHLLMVKCDVVAELLHVEKDSFVVCNNSIVDNS